MTICEVKQKQINCNQKQQSEESHKVGEQKRKLMVYYVNQEQRRT